MRRREALSSREEWRVRHAPPPWSALDTRRHRILDAIFKEVERRGGSISRGDKGAVRATIDGEKIDFLVREKSKQVKVPPSDSRSSYLSTDLVGTGKLVIAVKTYLRGPYNEEWRETDKKPLELMLTAFVDRLFEGSRILKAWHLEQEEERKRWAEQAARRAEIERQKADDKVRREKLIELSRQWQTVEILHNMLNSLLAAPHDPAAMIGDRSAVEWTEWARSVIADLRAPVTSLDTLFNTISATKGHYG